jgi:hypothetical protein
MRSDGCAWCLDFRCCLHGAPHQIRHRPGQPHAVTQGESGTYGTAHGQST